MAFARFMASFWGRTIRVVAGVALVWWGMGVVSTTGIIVAIIGAVVALARVFNVCFLAPLFGAPFRGKDLSSQPMM